MNRFTNCHTGLSPLTPENKLTPPSRARAWRHHQGGSRQGRHPEIPKRNRLYPVLLSTHRVTCSRGAHLMARQCLALYVYSYKGYNLPINHTSYLFFNFDPCKILWACLLQNYDNNYYENEIPLM